MGANVAPRVSLRLGKTPARRQNRTSFKSILLVLLTSGAGPMPVGRRSRMLPNQPGRRVACKADRHRWVECLRYLIGRNLVPLHTGLIVEQRPGMAAAPVDFSDRAAASGAVLVAVPF